MVVVEDTVLIIEGKPYTDIKFRLKEIQDNLHYYLGKSVFFVVTLSFVNDGYFYCMEGEVAGVIGKPVDKGYSFDPYIYVQRHNSSEKSQVSMARLKLDGEKNTYSSRTMAVKKLLTWAGLTDQEQKLAAFAPVDSLPPWEGSYQA